MFPASLFPPAVFPGSLYPGTGPVSPIQPLDIDNEVANWLASRLGVEVFPGAIPEGTTDYPVLVYQVIDGADYQKASGMPGSYAWHLYQVDAYSPRRSEVGVLSERLRMLLSGYSGPMGAATIIHAGRRRPGSGYDPTGTGQDNAGMYRRMSEYVLYFDQASPTH